MTDTPSKVLITLFVRIPGVALWFFGVTFVTTSTASIAVRAVSSSASGPELLLPLGVSVIAFGFLIFLGQTMRCAADVLTRIRIAMISSGQLFVLTLLDGLKTLIYCIGIGTAGSCLLAQAESESIKSLWLLPVAAIIFFGAHALGRRRTLLNKRWEEEVLSALPPSSSPELPLNTPPR